MSGIKKTFAPALPVSRDLRIGLFGFGVVGNGLYEVLQATPALQSVIKKICIKNPGKKRLISGEHFTTQASELLDDAEINVILELIDDADAAYEIVKAALQKGKSVVSANKKMIAKHFSELLELQQEFGAALLYEGACCASIPIIRNLEEYYDNDLLSAFRGIINGSTNYILTRIDKDNLSFKEALLEAQQLGFAESDPALDIEGHDAANKLSILLAHAFGTVVSPEELIYTGIAAIKESDANLARQRKVQIKLVGTAKRIGTDKLAAFVLPQFVSADDELSNVSNEFNGLVTESSFADKHFFKGKGAGAFPTAAAVLSDIAALRYNYKYEYKKIAQQANIIHSHDYYLRVFVSASGDTVLDKSNFEWIEEWHNDVNQSWTIAVISAKNLAATRWWKEDGISLILCEDPFIDNVQYKKISKLSLSLAGIE
ncbi:MAG: homoserine dehydrogenase [Ferruginibacter sp.]|nr:homoserine dehydrogenase [Ferruginibacter sp.]